MVADKGYYDVLGVKPTATVDEIKQAFRRQAMRWHPDRNPDNREEAEARFKEINTAHETLTDPKKRQVYDQYGEEGLREGGGGPGPDPSDIFGAFFGGGGGRRGGPKRTSNIVFNLSVAIEDLYKGRKTKLNITRETLCMDCLGRGAVSAEAVKQCGVCNGSGRRVITRRAGNAIEQTVATCASCQGSGQTVDAKDKCPGCKGARTLPRAKEIEVDIRPGMVDGQKLVFPGEADQAADAEPGDLVVVLSEIEDTSHEAVAARYTKRKLPSPSRLRPLFKHLGDGGDLVMTHRVQLIEALTGFTVTFEHLDGRIINVRSPAGRVLNHNSTLVVRGEGMPDGRAGAGDLYITIEVAMPQHLTPDVAAQLAALLPTPESPPLAASLPTATTLQAEYFDLEKAKKEAEERQRAQQKRFEEEGGPRMGQPQCQQM